MRGRSGSDRSSRAAKRKRAAELAVDPRKVRFSSSGRHRFIPGRAVTDVGGCPPEYSK
jgi:hypothetical protein